MSRLAAYGEREKEWSSAGLDGCIGELEALTNLENDYIDTRKSAGAKLRRRVELVEDAIQKLYEASEL
jgi:hypothetical protein